MYRLKTVRDRLGALRGLTATGVIAALVACSGQPAGQSPDPPPASPSATVAMTATPEPSPSRTATPEPTSSSSPTATPFGASVFDDPDDCEHTSGAYRVAFPESWWWNTEYDHPDLGTIAACRYFGPEQFDITTASREEPAPEGIALHIDYVDGGCIGFINPVLDERETTIDGHPATVREFAQGKEPANPPGHYQYEIDLMPGTDCETGGRFIVATTGVDMVGDYEQNKDMLDRMMETMEIREP